MPLSERTVFNVSTIDLGCPKTNGLHLIPGTDPDLWLKTPKNPASVTCVGAQPIPRNGSACARRRKSDITPRHERTIGVAGGHGKPAEDRIIVAKRNPSDREPSAKLGRSMQAIYRRRSKLRKQ